MAIVMVAATVCICLAWETWPVPRHPEAWAGPLLFGPLQLFASLAVARVVIGHHFGRLEGIAVLAILGALLAAGGAVDLVATDPFAEVARGRSIWTTPYGCLQPATELGGGGYSLTGVFLLSTGAAVALSSSRRSWRAAGYGVVLGGAMLAVIVATVITSLFPSRVLGLAAVVVALAVFLRTSRGSAEDADRLWTARLLAVVAVGAALAANALAGVSTIRSTARTLLPDPEEAALAHFRNWSSTWPWLALCVLTLLLAATMPRLLRRSAARSVRTTGALAVMSLVVLVGMAAPLYAEQRLFVEVVTRVHEQRPPIGGTEDLQLAAIRKGGEALPTDFEVRSVQEHAARRVQVSGSGLASEVPGAGAEIEFAGDDHATVEDFVSAVLKHSRQGDRVVLYAGN